MDVPETRRHAFVIEVRADAGDNWYGAIWHVGTSREDEHTRLYFRRLADIPLYIAPYLQDLGIDLGLGWLLWRWVFGLGRARA